MTDDKGYVAPSANLPEITFRVVILSIILSLILAISNAYLALKAGILTSASIPAAIISMGILRFFKGSNILENNLVQTAASAGEAVAGGIVYTIPALIIIHYWTAFDYWQNFFIALIGGFLGVLFSIPLRRMLMRNKKLIFPEGRAIAELLKISDYQKLGVKDIFIGGLLGAVFEFLQTGVKLFANIWEVWGKTKSTVIGFGLGFSPALIGAGYLIGIELSLCIFIGAFISWFLLIPIFSHVFPDFITANDNATTLAHHLWGDKIRYVGIGAMLTAGLLTLGNLLKPLLLGIQSTESVITHFNLSKVRLRTEKDIPFIYGLLMAIIFTCGLYFLYQDLFPLKALGLTSAWTHTIIFSVFLYTIIAGFLFCAITAYLSGMVGVSASPGSAIIIACLLIIAFFIYLILKINGSFISPTQMKACEAIVIMCTSVITGMAAISNDNMQDLKVGHLLGATPWKQQLMLLLGVLCASLIITPVMQLLYQVYGIAGVMPHAGMNASLSLPAPPAAVMAVLSEAVFQQTIPWNMLFLGGSIVILFGCFNLMLRNTRYTLSILGIAIGIYLPLSSSMALVIGGVIAWFIKQAKHNTTHRDTMLACGLIAGAAMMDVFLAIPFVIMHNPELMNLAPPGWQPISILLSLLATFGLYHVFKRLK